MRRNLSIFLEKRTFLEKIKKYLNIITICPIRKKKEKKNVFRDLLIIFFKLGTNTNTSMMQFKTYLSSNKTRNTLFKLAEHNSIYTKENEKLISYNKVKVILLLLEHPHSLPLQKWAFQVLVLRIMKEVKIMFRMDREIVCMKYWNNEILKSLNHPGKN